jgi:hypothetical protein
MVCYVYDCNYVKVIPMKSRSASERVKAYDTIHQELTVKGFKPKLQTLDNEALAALKIFFTANDVDYQLVPPHCHHSEETSVKVHYVSNATRIIPRPKRCHGNIPRSNMSQDVTGSFKEYSCTNAPAFMHLINLTAS